MKGSKNSKKSKIDVEELKEKIVSNFSFISNALDRVPDVYWTNKSNGVTRSGGVDATSGAQKAKVKKKDCKGVDETNPTEEVKSSAKSSTAFKTNGQTNSLEKGRKKEPKKKSLDKIVSQKKHSPPLKPSKSPSLQTVKSNNPDVQNHKPVKPIFNSEGKMVFSKFDLKEVDAVKKKKRQIRNPNIILEKLQEKKEYLKKLKSDGKVEKMLELKNKDAWQTALERAEGKRVKDDPALLKKSIKRIESRKRSSGKKWKDRIAVQDKGIEERIKKREANIAERISAKKQKRVMKAVKKGRIIPGF